MLDPIAGDCWARRQLCSGIRYVPTASKLMKWLSSVEAVYMYQAFDILLDNRLLSNCLANHDTLCWMLLVPTPALQQYKVPPCGIRTQGFAVFCREDLCNRPGNIVLDSGLLHNRCTDYDPLWVRLLGLTPPSQWYKVHLCRIGTREFAVIGVGCMRD